MHLRRMSLLAGISILALLAVGPAFSATQAAGDCISPNGYLSSCVRVFLTPSSLQADFYIDGQFAARTNSIDYLLEPPGGIGTREGEETLWELKNISDPSDPNVGVLYTYADATLTTVAPPKGTRVEYEVKPQRVPMPGKAEVHCDIKNHTGENVFCSVTIDGTAQPDPIAPGAMATYTLPAGSHTLVVALGGDPTHTVRWTPASQTKTITVAVGGTPKRYSFTFTKSGQLVLSLDKSGVVADFYVDGALIATQVASVAPWVKPGVSHKVEVRNLTDPAAAGVYTWKTTPQYVSVRSGEVKNVVLKLQKQYLKGFLELTCDIKGYAGENVACTVTIDGAVQPATIAPSQKATYTLNPGTRAIAVALTGDPAHVLRWSPATFAKSVTIRAGATPTKLSATFNKGGHLVANMDQPGAVADWYVDGVQVATQVAILDTYVPPNANHKVEARRIFDLSIMPKYSWTTPAQTVTVASNQTKTLTFHLEKVGKWAVDFQFRFPPGYWTQGKHTYTLSWTCPSFRSSSSQSFFVVANAEQLPGDLYLTYLGVHREKVPNTPGVSFIHENQDTVANFTLIHNEKPADDAATGGCAVNILVDGTKLIVLPPVLPAYQFE